MNGARRMEPLVRHAERRERDAAGALGEARRAVAEAEHRLAALEQYHREYRSRFDAHAAVGIPVAAARDYQSFLAQIDTGLARARAELDRLLGRCREAEARWLERRGRRRALARVVERRLEEEQRARARRDQRRIDEIARRPSAPR